MAEDDDDDDKPKKRRESSVASDDFGFMKRNWWWFKHLIIGLVVGIAVATGVIVREYGDWGEDEEVVEEDVEEHFPGEKYFDECKHIRETYYQTPSGHDFAPPLAELTGLPRTATEEEVDARCRRFAEIVLKMQTVSLKTRHVFVCGESVLDISKGFFLGPDDQDRGARYFYRTSEGQEVSKLIPIRVRQDDLFRAFHIYNFGERCLIVGLPTIKTALVPRLGGEVVSR